MSTNVLPRNVHFTLASERQCLAIHVYSVVSSGTGNCMVTIDPGLRSSNSRYGPTRTGSRSVPSTSQRRPLRSIQEDGRTEIRRAVLLRITTLPSYGSQLSTSSHGEAWLRSRLTSAFWPSSQRTVPSQAA